jgi:hypothetical protein
MKLSTPVLHNSSAVRSSSNQGGMQILAHDQCRCGAQNRDLAWGNSVGMTTVVRNGSTL